MQTNYYSTPYYYKAHIKKKNMLLVSKGEICDEITKSVKKNH